MLPREPCFLKEHLGHATTVDEFIDVFLHYDQDGDGVIDHSETLAFLMDLLESQGEVWTFKELLEYKVDLVGNEKSVTADELFQVMRTHLEDQWSDDD